MRACPSCSTELAGASKFCPECGARLDVAAQPLARETRKVVTILFSDVTGSTALGEALDPEAVRTLMGRYFAAMRAVIERHGGTVEKFVGDAVMAVFGIPVLHEDDALRAVRAATDMREALAAVNAELSAERGVTIATRTGITTGEVVAGDQSAGQTLVTGDTVNTAARLEQAADPGEILIGAPTWRLVRDAVTAEPVEAVSAKGKATPVPAYRLVAVAAGVAGHARRLDAPLVGRERELARLEQAWRDAVEQRSPHLFTLLGAAGVGKSRLVREFLAGVADTARILRGRCLPYGEGITYWPLAEALRGVAGIVEADDRAAASAKLHALLRGERDAELLTERLATAVGLSDAPAPQAELFWAVRRTLEHLASQQPVAVVFEDIHWAEPTFLDLLEYIADWSRDAPLFLLAPARPDLLDARPGWGGGKLNATTVLLEALPADATSRLIDALPGGHALPEALRERITTTAEGNPLFVEELLAMLVDDGVLALVDGRWQAAGDLEQLPIPPTIGTLLAARLDHLPADERRVAERASVVGRVFEPEAVDALSPETGRPPMPALMALVRKELIRPDRSEVTGGDAFKFRHILIRDAAYHSLPKRERAELHERFADWLEQVVKNRAPEFAEIIGSHLEHAVRYRIALAAKVDTALCARAARWLRDAADQAYRRGDARAAGELFGRAIELEPLPAPASRRALPNYINTLINASDFASARAWVEKGRQSAAEAGDPRLEAWCTLLASRLDAYDRPADAEDLHPEEFAALRETFLECGDHLGLAAVEEDRAGNAWGIGAATAAAEAYARAADHASLAGHLNLAQQYRAQNLTALQMGAAPHSEVLDILTAGRAGMVGSAACIVELALAGSEAALGSVDGARERVAHARARLREYGYPLLAEIFAQQAAAVEMSAGEVSRACQILDASCHALRELGEKAYLSTSLGLLANLLCDAGNYISALERSTESEDASDPTDLLTEMLWRMARARSSVALGIMGSEEGWRLVGEALAISDRTEWLEFQALLLEAAASFAMSVDTARKAESYLREAAELYRQKGAMRDSARVQERLSTILEA